MSVLHANYQNHSTYNQNVFSPAYNIRRKFMMNNITYCNDFKLHPLQYKSLKTYRQSNGSRDFFLPILTRSSLYQFPQIVLSLILTAWQKRFCARFDLLEHSLKTNRFILLLGNKIALRNVHRIRHLDFLWIVFLLL